MMYEVDDIAAEALELGVEPGDVMVLHCAFSTVGPVRGGPAGLIEGLRRALGPAGTLVMPSMSDDDDHPFEVAQTPCPSMGVVADTFWRQPGVLRSDSPHAFAAIGPAAGRITAAHPPELPHGPDSPIGRVWQADGRVLLLGVGHDADTMIHLAEYLAGVRYRRQKYLTIRQHGAPQRLHYAEIDHCCENFRLLDDWLAPGRLQRRGTLAAAPVRLVRARDVVATAVPRLQSDETVFLHPAGFCEECDDARRSLPAPESDGSIPR